MIRFLAILCATAVAALAQPKQVPTPAAAGATGPSLATTSAGTAVLSWLEPTGPDAWRLRVCRFDDGRQQWAEAVTISEGTHWFVNWADFPTVTPLSEDNWMAVWFVENPAAAHGGAAGHHGAGYHAVYSLSDDAGMTWSKPQPTTGESRSTEFTSVLALGENSRALVAWLDGRQRSGGGADQQGLYAQTFLASGPDQLVDARVCDCCQLALALVPDGALLAYRDRDDTEVRDIRIARWRDGRWQGDGLLHADGWKIAACPVNGPRLVSHGANVAAVWFTGAQDEPRVQLKFSRDGGATWGAPVRVDLGRPEGRVDCVLRPDGSALVTWLERPGGAGRAGGIYRRIVHPDGLKDEPELLAGAKTTRASGFPRLAQLPDGRVLLAYTQDDEPSRITTLLLDPK